MGRADCGNDFSNTLWKRKSDLTIYKGQHQRGAENDQRSIIKLSKKQNLTYLEAEEVMDEIMSGKATPVQMSAYLTALALKGETIDEDYRFRGRHESTLHQAAS